MKGTMKPPGSGTVTLAIKSPNILNQSRDKMDELYKEAKILAYIMTFKIFFANCVINVFLLRSNL